MAKVIFSMTAGVPHGDDYTQPTGDTPISLGEVEGKSYFSIDDGNTTIVLTDPDGGGMRKTDFNGGLPTKDQIKEV